jgi:AraC-like DNA-binding protein
VWREIGSLRTDTHGDRDFSAEALFGTVGTLKVCHLTASHHRVVRTTDLIRRDDRGYFKAIVQRRGETEFRQSGRHVTLAPGDWSLYDMSLPYSVNNRTAVEQIVAIVPRRVLAIPGVHLDRLTVHRFGRNGGIGKLAATYLTTMLDEYAKLSERTRLEAGDIATNLVRLALYESAGQPSTGDREILMERIKDYVGRHLCEPDLSIDKIAGALNCSKRTLHDMFRDEPMSLSEYIWARRLEGCRLELRSPGNHVRSLTEIAFRWGFSNYAHFSRVFKRRFGTSPREFRETLASHDPPHSNN